MELRYLSLIAGRPLLLLVIGLTPVHAANIASVDIEVPQDRYADVNGIQLHYLDWGGDGEIMLLVPGLSHTAHTYDAIAPAFRDRYRVIAVTRREHGASDKSESVVALETLVDDLADFLALFTSKPAVITGQSFAGIEISRLASEHPELVRALIFLDAVYDWPGLLDEQPQFPGYFDVPGSFDSYGTLEAWFQSTYPDLWSEATQAHLISQTKLNVKGDIDWQFPIGGIKWNHFTAVYKNWNKAEFAELNMPILSIQAEQGGYMKANLTKVGATTQMIESALEWAKYDNELKRRGHEMLAQAAPHAVLVNYENIHHWLHLQSPGKVIQEIDEFLRNHVAD